MTRILFWIALIILVALAIRAKLRAAVGRQAAAARRGTAPARQNAEAMACCAQCGVYFPASEVVRAGGRDYCCPAHARLPSTK